MDHLVTTAAEICQLINLGNVVTMDAAEDIFNSPAVCDLVVDVLLYPSEFLRYRLTWKEKIKNSAPDSLTANALITRHEVHRRGFSFLAMSGQVQPAADGLIVSGNVRQSIKDHCRINCEEEIGKMAIAWLEFNYLLLHKPRGVRTWRRPADADQRAILFAGKSAPKKIYVRMRKLPPLTDTEKWAELRPASSGSSSGEFIRHCDAWGVHGHYRHYKSGSVVYIAPYVKGPDRSQYRGREYELLVNK